MARALEAADQAQERRDHQGLVEALRASLDACEADPEVPVAIKRQLMVQLSKTLQGELPPGAEAEADESALLEGLRWADAALELKDVDEPEAHFARIRALKSLGRHKQALKTIINLTGLSQTWAEASGEQSYDVEKRIVSESLEVLTLGRAMDRRDQILYRLASLNPRIERVLGPET